MIVWSQYVCRASQQWKFCFVLHEGFPIVTESALWLADSTKSKLHAACALLEDTTGCSGELKLIWTAYSVKRNSDSVCNLLPTTRVDDSVVKCAFRTVKQPAENYFTAFGLSALKMFNSSFVFDLISLGLSASANFCPFVFCNCF